MQSRTRVAAGTAALMSLALAGGPVQAAGQEREQCFGVSVAGQNDCASIFAVHSCAGQSKVDGDKREWRYVAKGTCKLLGGLSTEQAKQLKKG